MASGLAFFFSFLHCLLPEVYAQASYHICTYSLLITWTGLWFCLTAHKLTQESKNDWKIKPFSLSNTLNFSDIFVHSTKTKLSDLQPLQLVHQELGRFKTSCTKKIWQSGSVLYILFMSQSMLIWPAMFLGQPQKQIYVPSKDIWDWKEGWLNWQWREK